MRVTMRPSTAPTRLGLRLPPALLVLLAAIVPVPAEVGVSIRPDATGDSIVTAVYITGLTDDPDPVLGAWLSPAPATMHRRPLNTQGVANGDGRPFATYLEGSATAIAVWSRHAGGGFEIVVSRFDRAGAGAWTTPTVISASPALTVDSDPVVLQDPVSGALHIFWWEDVAAPRVVHSEAAADLSTFGTPQAVSDPADLAVRPTATFHEGTLHLAYEAHAGALGGTPREIVVGELIGTTFDFETIATTGYAGVHRPEIHSAPGRLWVDWVDAVGEMTWTRRQGNGYWEPIDSEPFVGAEEREFRVRSTIKSVAIE